MDVFVNENEELIKQVQLLRLCRKVQLWQSHSAAYKRMCSFAYGKVQLWQSHSAASTSLSAAFRASSKVVDVFAYEN